MGKLEERLSRVPIIGTAMAVQKRYGLDAADQLAAAIGFFAFLSLIPLLLLTIAVLGFVVTDPAQQTELALSLTEAIPGFGSTTTRGDEVTAVGELLDAAVEQRGAITGIGLITLALTGLKVINAAMTASTVVLRAELPSGPRAKLRQILAVVGLGALALAAVAGSGLAGADEVLPAAAAVVLGLVVSFVFDLALFLGAYRLLAPTSGLGVRDLVPGAMLGAVGWTVLKVAGATYVGRQIESANALYGTLGSVIGLLILLYLAGRLYLYGAELTAVLAERRLGPLRGSVGSLVDLDLPPGTRAERAPAGVRVLPMIAPAAPAEVDGPPARPAVGRPREDGPAATRTGSRGRGRAVGFGPGLAAYLVGVAALGAAVWRIARGGAR